MVGDLCEVVALGGHPIQGPVVADGEPVDLPSRHHQPEGHPTGIPPDVHRVSVAADDGVEILLPAVGEVVNVVPGDEVECVEVRPVSAEEVELLIHRRGDLVHVHAVQLRLVAAQGSDPDVAQVCDVQRAIWRHCHGGGGFQLGIPGIATIA